MACMARARARRYRDIAMIRSRDSIDSIRDRLTDDLVDHDHERA